MTLGSTTEILFGGTCRAALPAFKAWSDQLCGLEALTDVFVKTNHGKKDQGLTKGSPAGPTRLEAFCRAANSFC